MLVDLLLFLHPTYQKKIFKNKISPELRSRFDYVGIFNLLTDEDKVKFVKYRFSEIIKKYESEMKCELPGNAHIDLVSRISVSRYKNMRHLNKKIKDTFVEYIEEVAVNMESIATTK